MGRKGADYEGITRATAGIGAKTVEEIGLCVVEEEEVEDELKLEERESLNEEETTGAVGIEEGIKEDTGTRRSSKLVGGI